MFFNTTLEKRLEDLVETHKAAIRAFAQKLIEDIDKPGMLRSYFSWSSNQIRSATKCEVFQSYLEKLRAGLEQHDPSTPEETIAFYELLRSEAIRHLSNRASSITGISSLPSSNESSRAEIEALADILDDIDWYLTRLKSESEQGEAA